MAPEQAAGQTKEVGPAADVVRAGGDPLRVLTGRPPFRAATALRDARAGARRTSRCRRAQLQRRGAARPGDDLPEVPAEGAAPSATPAPPELADDLAASCTASRSSPGRSRRRSGSGGGRRQPGGRRPAVLAAVLLVTFVTYLAVSNYEISQLNNELAIKKSLAKLPRPRRSSRRTSLWLPGPRPRKRKGGGQGTCTGRGRVASGGSPEEAGIGALEVAVLENGKALYRYGT